MRIKYFNQNLIKGKIHNVVNHLGTRKANQSFHELSTKIVENKSKGMEMDLLIKQNQVPGVKRKKLHPSHDLC